MRPGIQFALLHIYSQLHDYILAFIPRHTSGNRTIFSFSIVSGTYYDYLYYVSNFANLDNLSRRENSINILHLFMLRIQFSQLGQYVQTRENSIQGYDQFDDAIVIGYRRSRDIGKLF